MKQLKAILQPLKGRGIRLRIEPHNKLFLSGGVNSMSQPEKTSIKRAKPLLVLILPEGRNYTIAQLLEALERMINYSEGLVINTDCEMHSADLKALPVGRVYLESLIVDMPMNQE